MATSLYMSHPLFRSKKNKSKALRLVEHKADNLLQLTLSLVLIWGGWLAFDVSVSPLPEKEQLADTHTRTGRIHARSQRKLGAEPGTLAQLPLFDSG